MRTYPFDVIEQYKSGKALTALAKEHNSDWKALKYFLQRNNVEIRGQKKHPLNKDYFKEVDSNEKAYFLGLLWADGSIMKFRKNDEFLGKIKLSLVEEDSYLVESLRISIGHGGSLKLVKKQGNRQNQKSLQIADKEFAANVERLGMKPNKTYDGGIPLIDEKFMPAFILGYFDGDGCFTSWENPKRMEKKCCYSLAVHPDTCFFIRDYMCKIGIKSYIEKPKNKPIYNIVINGNIQCVKFFNLMYSVKDDIPIFLQRKYLKAKYFLEKYGAAIKVKYNLPLLLRTENILKRGEELLSGETLSSFKKEWLEIQSRENIIPSATSSQRFLPCAQNKPVS